MSSYTNITPELLEACRHGNIDTVRTILSDSISLTSKNNSIRRFDINEQGRKGDTPLHACCIHGHLNIAKLLLSTKNISLTIRNQKGWTPLHFCCWFNHSKIAELLLSTSDTIDLYKIKMQCNKQTNDGFTAIMLACSRGHVNIVKLLLLRCKDYIRLDLPTTNGDTALIRAAYKGYTDIIELLMDNDDDINTANFDGKTALIAASERGHYNTVLKLLQLSSNSSKFYLDIDHASNENKTALMYSVIKNHSNITQLLLVHGANGNHRDNNGITPLLVATDNNDIDAVKALVTTTLNNTTITSITNDFNNSNNNIYRNNTATTIDTNTSISIGISTSKSHDNDVEICNNRSYDSNSIILGNSHSNELIINRHNSNTSTNSVIDSISSLVAYDEDSSNVHDITLLSSPLPPLGSVNGNASPSLLISQQQQKYQKYDYASLPILQDMLCDINCVDLYGTSPLMYACGKGNEEIVSLLLSFSHCKTDIIDDFDMSAIMYASAKGHFHIIYRLIDHGVSLTTSVIDGLNDLGYDNEVKDLIIEENKFKKWINYSNLLIFLDKCGSLPVHEQDYHRIKRYLYLKERVLNIIQELEEDQHFYFTSFNKCFSNKNILKNILKFIF